MEDNEKRKHVEYTSSPQKSLAYIIIGIGVIWLLLNLVGWSLWPLLLLGIGILMLTGNLRPGDVQHHHFHAPVDGAESVEVDINLEVGEATLRAMEDETALFDAEIAHLGDVNFSVTGDQNRLVSLKHAESFAWRWLNPANWFSHYDNLDWDVGLNRTVPTDLHVSGGAGKAMLNLDGVNLSGINVKSGVGEVELNLPATDAGYDAYVHGGVGEFDITIAVGTAVNLKIEGGVGEFKIHTPRDSAVRIEARMGVGEVKAGSRFNKISGGHTSGIGGSGTWETEGFGSAERQIVIHFNGGVGELKVD